MSGTVVKIKQLEPMTGYDSIEMATVLDWHVVVKRGEFSVGDLACYCSIGTILPAAGFTEFLGGKPLKTKRYRDYFSQGLVVPLAAMGLTGALEGDDVTERIGAVKYHPVEEDELYTEDADKAPWYGLVPKTDEKHGQAVLGMLTNHLNQEIVITIKYDGTSSTYIWLDSGTFMVCNRNHRLLKINGNSKVYFDMAVKYDIEAGMRELGRNLAIQGEITGPKINGNRHGVSSFALNVFNIYDITTGSYLPWDEVVELCSKLGLMTVPVVYRGPVKPEHQKIDELLKLANELKHPNGRICEGIVMKTVGEPRFSCKIIAPVYLVKNNL